MKRTLMLVTLGIASVIMAKQLFFVDYIDAEAMERDMARMAQLVRDAQAKMMKGKTNDAELKEAIRLIPKTSFVTEEWAKNLAQIVRESEISQDQVITMLEKMTREKVSAVEKGESDYGQWGTFEEIYLFAAFPKYDARPIIEECLRSTSNGVRFEALTAYVEIAGAKSIPLLQEALTTGRLDDDHRNRFYKHLDYVSRVLKNENKTNDVEEITVFLTEMRQPKGPKED